MNIDLLLRALADRTRLRLLNLMRDHEVCVCYFVEALRESQPKISRHLAYLRRTGLVAARRSGLWQHYRIVTPTEAPLQKLLQAALAAIAADSAAQRDIERLSKACCNPEKFVRLQPAPTPTPLKSGRS